MNKNLDIIDNIDEIQDAVSVQACNNISDVQDLQNMSSQTSTNDADDVIVISDDEEQMCRDIVMSELSFKTEIYTLTVTRRIGYLNDRQVTENFHIEKDYFAYNE